jgi:signal transduction histidine kinase/ActR/RegA family two-component response regulator
MANDPLADLRASGEPWPHETAEVNERRVLILAPTANDARLTAGFLGTAGIDTLVVPGLCELIEKMKEGCGAVLLAQEVMTNLAAPRLFAALRRQPTWSDLPITLITSGGVDGEERMRRLTAFDANSNITVLERPFRPATLVSAVEVALRSRQRQYQVRKLLKELEEARDAAERANQAKDEFLAALSHELRTPLNPVLLLATEAAADPVLPAAVRQDFDDIARNVMLEARLIDDLLDLTRITQGKLHLDLRLVDAHGALQAALDTTQPEILAKKLAVEADWRATETSLRADPVRLQQILWNVLKNAAKFTPSGGMIRIETENVEGELVIRITDTGVGMEPAELARVFNAFAQGNHARINTGHRFGGLGLGLAISRRLVELHDGKITASSKGPGTGSTFSIELPVSRERTPVAREALVDRARHEPPGERKRLLVVEDHAATRASLVRMMERRGYEVRSAQSLTQARELVETGTFDLVLSDLGLPDGSGHELMRELRDRSGIPGIALSGFGMETDVLESRAAGFVAHLTKPVTAQALDAALERVTSSQVGLRAD